MQSNAGFHEMEGHASKEGTSSASAIVAFRLTVCYGKKTWSGFDTSTWLFQQKIRNVNNWQVRKINARSL